MASGKEGPSEQPVEEADWGTVWMASGKEGASEQPAEEADWGTVWMASGKEGASEQGPMEEHGEATEDQEDEDDAEVRLILVGKSGGGKSATGNTILGRKEFESLLTAKTTTMSCKRGKGTWGKNVISVLDTPALFDAEKTETSPDDQLARCRRMCAAGLHAFLLVTQVGRFTAEDAEVAKEVWKFFGDESARRAIVLFTCKEDLGGDCLKEYVGQTKNERLRKLMKKCHGRLCGFNNKAVGDERDKQVDRLMRMVKEIVAENGGEPYVIPEDPDKSNQVSKQPQRMKMLKNNIFRFMHRLRQEQMPAGAEVPLSLVRVQQHGRGGRAERARRQADEDGGGDRCGESRGAVCHPGRSRQIKPASQTIGEDKTTEE